MLWAKAVYILEILSFVLLGGISIGKIFEKYNRIVGALACIVAIAIGVYFWRDHLCANGFPSFCPAPVTPQSADPQVSQKPRPQPAPQETPSPPEISRSDPTGATFDIRRYVVFFDHGKDILDQEATRVLRGVVHDYRTYDSTNILVRGYDDLSGSPRDSQLISERRATSVADKLIWQGVPRMYVAALGQKDPMVPTARGVREPQNRRVEIVMNATPKDISDAGARLYTLVDQLLQ